jgi:DNA-binding NarL/FixJ family response regulator
METIISFFYNHSKRFILFNFHPSFDLKKLNGELQHLKNFFGDDSKVIISSEGYVDELVKQCDRILYDAYVLSSDDREVLDQAATTVLAGNFYLSKNVVKAYFQSRRCEYDQKQA